MKNINITVENKRAAVVGSPVIICGNSDYTVTFAFDNEWSLTGPKTARFVYVKRGEVMHEDVPFSGNTVAVPVLSDVTFVNVGVFAGDLCTTTPARVNCHPSILCGSGIVQAPTPDVYSQIMALFESMAEKGAFGATEAQAQQIEQNRQNIAALEAGTKKAGDANKLGGYKIEEFVANENLIINPNFKIGATPVTNVYGTKIVASKWFISSDSSTVYSAEVKDEGLYMETSSAGSYVNIYQDIPNLEPGTYTVSFWVDKPENVKQVSIGGVTLSGGNAYSFKINGNIVTNKLTVSGITGSGYPKPYIQQKTEVCDFTIKWVKVERGAVATPYVPPNETEEKLKCGATVGDAETLGGHGAEDFLQNTGGTVTGALNIDSAVFGANVRSTSLEKGTLPSSTAYLSVNLMEKGGTTHKNRVGQLQTSVDTSGNTQTAINAFKFEKDGATAQSLGVVCTPDGTGYGFAPTVSNANDSSNKIATTKWVNNFALPKTGGNVNGLTIANKTVHHDGNSAKVHIGTSAPSDTSALWIDTSA